MLGHHSSFTPPAFARVTFCAFAFCGTVRLISRRRNAGGDQGQLTPSRTPASPLHVSFVTVTSAGKDCVTSALRQKCLAPLNTVPSAHTRHRLETVIMALRCGTVTQPAQAVLATRQVSDVNASTVGSYCSLSSVENGLGMGRHNVASTCEYCACQRERAAHSVRFCIGADVACGLD